jgi:predicted transcriptional regulator
MLGIRLNDQDEGRLARHARERGRAKSAIARDWIVERLDREAVDEQIRHAASLDATARAELISRVEDDAATAWLRSLDAEDGGFDWGPDGPPA